MRGSWRRCSWKCRSRGSAKRPEPGEGPVALAEGAPRFRQADYGVHGVDPARGGAAPSAASRSRRAPRRSPAAARAMASPASELTCSVPPPEALGGGELPFGARGVTPGKRGVAGSMTGQDMVGSERDGAVGPDGGTVVPPGTTCERATRNAPPRRTSAAGAPRGASLERPVQAVGLDERQGIGVPCFRIELSRSRARAAPPGTRRRGRMASPAA